jgi:hypothetical protein
VALRRLALDATADDLRERLLVGRDGFAAEGRCPDLSRLDEPTLAVGPRLGPDVRARARTRACPATSGAVMLGPATEAEARYLAARPAPRRTRDERPPDIALTARLGPRCCRDDGRTSAGVVHQ